MTEKFNLKKEVYQMIDDGFPVVTQDGKKFYGRDAKIAFHTGGCLPVIAILCLIVLACIHLF